MDILKHTDNEVRFITSLLSKLNESSHGGFNFSVEHNSDGSLTILDKGELVKNSLVFSVLQQLLGQHNIHVYNDEYVTCYTNRVVELFYIHEQGSHFIIETSFDEDRLKHVFDVDSLEEASLRYHKLTGKEVIDRREDRDHEYTNVDAQDDPDFWNEEPINDKVNYKEL